ncbi:TetR/AcrR family transcriptional regulator [Bacillus horti]|uniref:AcrR family transcriptional regulator n=1 Tax=Caldalkalibacillus horti TaxID=77523 RepID=A0ABT9W294_9BACI|nr:TetR/AcrR family transcriptional regulator [Bacillus horti]MDQ0166965.1 AcrR family transcriptional regulator [Bacillus horti]
MEFDRVRNAEQRKIRVEQIKNAAIKLFDTEQFHEIDLAKIAKETTFTRGNLYKYISSKEEIYLLVALDEFDGMLYDIKQTFVTEMTHDIPAFARQWAEALDRHPRFLKLISMLFTMIERNVTLERLVDFKKQYLGVMNELSGVMKMVFPAWDDKTINKFLQLQSHYVIGLFPYTSPAPIQKEAMEQSGIHYEPIQFVDQVAEFVAYTVSYLDPTLKANK